MGYCDDCGNTFCVCDIETKNSYPYRMKIKELEAQLEKAESVIRFYADWKNYSASRHSYFENYFAEIKNDHSIIKVTEADGDKFLLPFAGNKAREYFEGKDDQKN